MSWAVGYTRVLNVLYNSERKDAYKLQGLMSSQPAIWLHRPSNPGSYILEAEAVAPFRVHQHFRQVAVQFVAGSICGSSLAMSFGVALRVCGDCSVEFIDGRGAPNDQSES